MFDSIRRLTDIVGRLDTIISHLERLEKPVPKQVAPWDEVAPVPIVADPAKRGPGRPRKGAK